MRFNVLRSGRFGALVLFAAEAMAPGAFMLWLGFAAVAMALAVLVAPGLELPLLAQVACCSRCSAFDVGGGLSQVVPRQGVAQSDKPLLNRRTAEQLVGQRRRAGPGDRRGARPGADRRCVSGTVEGPDLPVGMRVPRASP
jgi:hypothetical protein